MPIAKLGEDSKDPNNFCPITLTSFVCKTIERLMNDRLVCFLKSYTLIIKVSSGKQEAQCINFETLVRKMFLNGEDVVSVFSDLEKTYDTI